MVCNFHGVPHLKGLWLTRDTLHRLRGAVNYHSRRTAKLLKGVTFMQHIANYRIAVTAIGLLALASCTARGRCSMEAYLAHTRSTDIIPGAVLLEPDRLSAIDVDYQLCVAATAGKGAN